MKLIFLLAVIGFVSAQNYNDGKYRPDNSGRYTAQIVPVQQEQTDLVVPEPRALVVEEELSKPEPSSAGPILIVQESKPAESLILNEISKPDAPVLSVQESKPAVVLIEESKPALMLEESKSSAELVMLKESKEEDVASMEEVKPTDSDDMMEKLEPAVVLVEETKESEQEPEQESEQSGEEQTEEPKSAETENAEVLEPLVLDAEVEEKKPAVLLVDSKPSPMSGMNIILVEQAKPAEPSKEKSSEEEKSAEIMKQDKPALLLRFSQPLPQVSAEAEKPQQPENMSLGRSAPSLEETVVVVEEPKQAEPILSLRSAQPMPEAATEQQKPVAPVTLVQLVQSPAPSARSLSFPVTPTVRQPVVQTERIFAVDSPKYERKYDYNSEAQWKTLHETRESNLEGYNFSFDTENKISRQESGRVYTFGTDGTVLRMVGFFEFVGDDGILYRTDYIADENGYQPSGAHIPK